MMQPSLSCKHSCNVHVPPGTATLNFTVAVLEAKAQGLGSILTLLSSQGFNTLS